ncbi:MAG: hypothetical protein ACRDOJ_01050 [Nocardioidaceae bacterium]
MRSNGLTANDYAPLAELDRSVAADALLALREAGVAAYAVLAEDDRPHRATLFADRAALTRARAVVHTLAPEARTIEHEQVDEAAWEQIVAGYSATASEPDEPGQSADLYRSRAPEPHPLVRDDEDHFVPEPPPPPPDIDLISRLAWAGVFGGPILLLVATLLTWVPPRAVVLVCVLGFVGGIVTLVLRMKDGPPDDPDNGAVV